MGQNKVFSQIIKHNRFFLLLAVVLSFLVSFSFIDLGWFLDDVFFRGLMTEKPEIRNLVPESASFTLWKGFYVFVSKNEEQKFFLKDEGIIPWWTSDTTQIAFWRPVSSLTLFLDFKAWPGKPAIMHLHSILWFMMIAGLASLIYKKILGKNWAPLLASLLFIVNRINYMTVAFISNRHALVAVAFGLLTLIFHLRMIRRDKISLLPYLFFFFALLSSEMGLLTFGYIISCTLFLDEQPKKERLKKVIPYIILIFSWRIAYNLLGFGVYGSELYADPVNSPFSFLASVLARAPLIVSSLFLGIPADVYNFVSAQVLVVTAFFLYPVLGLGIYFLYKKMKGDRIMSFWLFATLFSVFPLCATIPGDRNLIFASFGAMGLLAYIVFKLFPLVSPEKRIKNLWPRLMIFLLVIISLIGGVAGIFFVPTSMISINKNMDAFYDYGNDPELENQDLILVVSPAVHFIQGYTVERNLDGLPSPRHLQILAPALWPVSITRLDSQSLRVRPDSGFYPPPGTVRRSDHISSVHFDLLNFERRLERGFIDLSRPVTVGEKIELTNLVIRVTGLTEDERIGEAVFTFSVPLEDPSIKWMTWDSNKDQYVPFSLPEIDETITIGYPGFVKHHK